MTIKSMNERVLYDMIEILTILCNLNIVKNATFELRRKQPSNCGESNLNVAKDVTFYLRSK